MLSLLARLDEAGEDDLALDEDDLVLDEDDEDDEDDLALDEDDEDDLALDDDDLVLDEDAEEAKGGDDAGDEEDDDDFATSEAFGSAFNSSAFCLAAFFKTLKSSFGSILPLALKYL